MIVKTSAIFIIHFLSFQPNYDVNGQNLGGDSFFSDWGLGGGRASQPTCVEIPKNLSLCHGIGYSKMRLPNLLDHDSMAEVLQQAVSWVPLHNVRCHPDTQLFLCSLFSPVCLERAIYPCRGLCERVRQGCEGRMKLYGYPWPDMLRCDKFPLDNDMCISPLSAQSNSDGNVCQACEQAETYENILDNFCRADFAVRTKLRRTRRNKVGGKKAKVLKMSTELREEWRRNKRPNLVLELGDHCCAEHLTPASSSKSGNGGDRFLVMGQKRNGQLIPTLILPWTKKSKAIRSAVKVFKKFNCSDPKAVFATESNSQQTSTNDNARQRRGKQSIEKSGPLSHTRSKSSHASLETTNSVPTSTTVSPNQNLNRSRIHRQKGRIADKDFQTENQGRTQGRKEKQA